MASTKGWRRGRDFVEVKEGAKKSVKSLRRESRACLVKTRRPSDLDMNSELSSESEDEMDHQSPNSSNLCLNTFSTPPKSRNDKNWTAEVSMACDVPDGSPTPTLLSPNPSVSSDSDYFSDGKEVQERVDRIKRLLFSNESGLEAKALTDFSRLLVEYRPDEYDCVYNLVHDRVLTDKLTSIVGVNNQQALWNDSSMVTDLNDDSGTFFTPAKIGFQFGSIQQENGFNLHGLQSCLQPDIVPRQDNRLICLALEAICGIVDEDHGKVFGNINCLVLVLIKHITTIKEKINRKLVQESLTLLLKLMEKSYGLDMKDEYGNRKKLFLKMLVDCQLFPALDHVTKFMIEDIAACNSTGIDPKDQYDILSAIVSIIRDFTDDMETEQASRDQPSSGTVDSGWGSQSDVVQDIGVEFDKEATYVMLLRILCQHLKRPEFPHLFELVNKYAILMVKYFGCDKERDIFKGPSVTIQLRKLKKTDSVETNLSTGELTASLLPFIQQLCGKNRPESIQLAGMTLLNNLPAEVVVEQGLFYPILDLVVAGTNAVKVKSLELLLKLVQRGPQQIMVICTTNILEKLITEMMVTTKLNIARKIIRLVRKLFQRAQTFNNRSDWIVLSGHQTVDQQWNGKVDIVSYLKNKLAEFKGTSAIWYTWYWKDDYVYYETEWIAEHIYPGRDWGSHTWQQALQEWSPVPQLDPVVIDTADGQSFAFNGPTKKPLPANPMNLQWFE